MPTIKQVTVYSFSELSDQAKETARNRWRLNAGDIDIDTDYECLRDDLESMLKLFGFDVDNVYYSGFWSQGDGASFTGRWSYRKGWRKAYLKDYPINGNGQDKEWHKQNSKILGYLDAIAAISRKHFYNAWCLIYHRGHYQHSGCMHMSNSDFDSEDEYAILQNFRWIADVFYGRLESAYEWRNADAQVDECIIINEYQFHENGVLV